MTHLNIVYKFEIFVFVSIWEMFSSFYKKINMIDVYNYFYFLIWFLLIELGIVLLFYAKVGKLN